MQEHLLGLDALLVMFVGGFQAQANWRPGVRKAFATSALINEISCEMLPVSYVDS